LSGGGRGSRAAGLLAVALIAVACGGGSGRLDKREFVGKANAICARADARIARLTPPDPADAAALARSGQKVVEIERDALVELRGLKAPEADDVKIQKWIALVDQTLDKAAESVAAQQAGDLQKANEANGEGRTVDQRADQIASAYGLDRCVGKADDLAPAKSTTSTSTG
jgi:hypothetical protein